MDSPKIPPRALDRALINDAFEWLSKQSEETKERAKDVPSMVNLYLHYKRYRESGKNLEKNQDFTDSLKAIQKNIGGLPVEEITPQSEEPTSQIEEIPMEEESSKLSEPTPSTKSDTPKQSSGAAPLPPPPHLFSFRDPQVSFSGGIDQTDLNVTVSMEHLTPECQLMVLETKKRLNLSSDAEALNAMISIAHQQLKKIFK